MHGSKQYFFKAQGGMSLIGLIFVMAIIGVLAALGMKVAPGVMEYMAIKQAIVAAKASNGSPHDIMLSFDKNAQVKYISSIKGQDLIIDRSSGQTEISFAYDAHIALFGPVSLLIEYAGSTAPNAPAKKTTADE